MLVVHLIPFIVPETCASIPNMQEKNVVEHHHA